MIIYFLAGSVFVVFALPFLQELSDLLCTLFEMWKSKMAVNIAKDNFEITKMRMTDELKPQIGFMVNNPQDDDEEFNDDEDSTHRTIGFTGGDN